MSFIQVIRVESCPDLARLQGASIDLPRAGYATDGADVEVAGWVLGRELPAIAVELVADGAVFTRAGGTGRREDVAAAFPSIVHEARTCFSTRVFVSGMADLRFEVRAVLADQTRCTVGFVD